jgi:hypothetical protein
VNKKEINELTEKIDTIQAHRNACITKYPVIQETHKKALEDKESVQKLIVQEKNKKIRNWS